MKNLIYYPTFEPQDIDWLKYALIYIDQFSPIVPDSGKSELSDDFKKLRDKTDLVDIYEPKWWQGDNAANKAIKEIEFIESHPELFRDKLKVVNINKTWRDPNNWRFEIYEEKFNVAFKHQCIEMGLGIESRNGIITSKELAQVFMTFLAEEIAFERVGNPITDSTEYDQLSTYLRAKNPSNENLISSAKTTVNISLPNDIRKIGIDKIIKFRNNSGINELRKAFNQTLSKFYQSLEDDFDPNTYIKSLETTNIELVKEIGLFFGGAVSATLGAMILLSNPDNLEMIKQIIEGTILTIGGITAINKAWSDGNEKRYARKFISRIQQIG